MPEQKGPAQFEFPENSLLIHKPLIFITKRILKISLHAQFEF